MFVLVFLVEPEVSARHIVELLFVKLYKIVGGEVLFGRFISEFGGSLYKCHLVAGFASLPVRLFELFFELTVISDVCH